MGLARRDRAASAARAAAPPAAPGLLHLPAPAAASTLTEIPAHAPAEWQGGAAGWRAAAGRCLGGGGGREDGAPEVVVGHVVLDMLHGQCPLRVLELAQQPLQHVIAKWGRHERTEVGHLGGRRRVGRAEDLGADQLELLVVGQHQHHLGHVGPVLGGGQVQNVGQQALEHR
eukprot:scaffold5892_cov112-Isochrysis_galbana.AAC.23